MPIENEMIIQAVLVLADARFQQRGAFHSGESHRHIFSRLLDCFGRNRPLAGSGIEGGSARVISDLEAAPFIAGNAVKERSPVIDPSGQPVLSKTRITWRGAKEEHLLAGRRDAIAHYIRKNLPKPGTASEHELIGGYMPAHPQPC